MENARRPQEVNKERIPGSRSLEPLNDLLSFGVRLLDLSRPLIFTVRFDRCTPVSPFVKNDRAQRIPRDSLPMVGSAAPPVSRNTSTEKEETPRTAKVSFLFRSIDKERLSEERLRKMARIAKTFPCM